MGLNAQKHLRIVADSAEPLTLRQVQEFLDSAREAGIPSNAKLTQPGGDALRRLPICFEVVWTEDL